MTGGACPHRGASIVIGKHGQDDADGRRPYI